MELVALDPHGASDVLAALDAHERRQGVPRLEAAERRRLAARASGGGDPAEDPERWVPHTVGGWYLGLRTPPDGGPVAEAGRLDGGPVTALLDAAASVAAGRLWLRDADPVDVAAAAERGWTTRRTLLVLGRPLTPDPTAVAPPAGLRLRRLGEVGAGPVAALLMRAYDEPRRTGLVEADPGAGPWTVERFRRVATVSLAAPEDLLVAVDPEGAPVGAHWTGRRAGGMGEVFNLAVDPSWKGRGLGSWLLTAGLMHLSGLGLREVVLWVDRENAPARALYARAGFVERGRDVAIGR